MKKALIFTFVRYIEFGLISLLYFGLANVVDVSEYGASARSFILITFTAFLALGTNQAVVKWFSKTDSSTEKQGLLLYNLLLNASAALIAIIVVFILVDTSYAIYAALVAGGKLIIEALSTVNRVHNALGNINVIYLSAAIPFSIVFWAGYIDSVHLFFQAWACFVGLGIIVAIALSIKIFRLYSSSLEALKNYLFKNCNGLIGDGLKLAGIGFLAPFLASSDKLFLSYTAFDKALLGSMQLADNIAMVVAYGVGSLVYAITPAFIKDVHEGKRDISDMYSKGYLILGVGIIGLLTVSIAVVPILRWFFPSYEIAYPLALYLFGRSLISGLFMFNIATMVFSDESTYLKYILVCVAFQVLALIILYLSLPVIDLAYLVFPLIGGVILVGLHFQSFSFSKKHYMVS